MENKNAINIMHSKATPKVFDSFFGAIQNREPREQWNVSNKNYKKKKIANFFLHSSACHTLCQGKKSPFLRSRRNHPYRSHILVIYGNFTYLVLLYTERGIGKDFRNAVYS